MSGGGQMSGHGRAAAIPRRARSWIAAAVLARATAWSPPRRTKPLPVIPCRPSRRTAAAEAAARCLGRTAIHSRRAMMNGHRSVADGRAGVNATVVRPPALSQPPHRAADRLHTSALSPCLALPCLALPIAVLGPTVGCIVDACSTRLSVSC